MAAFVAHFKLLTKTTFTNTVFLPDIHAKLGWNRGEKMISLTAWLKQPRPKSWWIVTVLHWSMIATFVVAGCIYLVKDDVVNGVGFILFALLVYAVVRLNEKLMI